MIKNMTIQEYHAAEGLSKSMMDKLKRSPAHLKESMDNPEQETEAMLLGSLLHTMLLEPNKVEEEYAVMPVVDRRTTAGRAAYSEFIELNAGKSVVTEAQFDLASVWAKKILEHPTARELLTGEGQNEVSIFWKDKETGELCKARPDRIKDGYIIDLKTAISSQPDDFERKAYELNYHIQAAWFTEAYINEFNRAPKGFIFIVVEKNAPYNVVIYEEQEFSIEIGNLEARKLLKTYHHCKQTGNWCGYDGEKQEIQPLQLPNWVIARNMEEL